MFYDLVVDGVETKVTLNKESLRFESNGTESTTYKIDNVIGCDEVVTGWIRRTEVTRVWLIEHGHSNLLLKKYKVVSGDQRKRFQHDLLEKTIKETKRPKRVLVMINPHGGNRTARKDFRDIVEPVFRLSGMSMDILFSEYPGHLIAATKSYDFANTDGIVLFGGDGTYHEVLNVLLKKRQEEQGVDINDPNAPIYPLNIPFGLIPTGSRCHWSLNHTGSHDVLTAALNIIQGKTVSSNLIALYSNGTFLGFGCAGFNCGQFTNVAIHRDRYFRWLGRSRNNPFIWMFLFKSLTQHVYKATITYYTCVTERHNPETNETEIFVADRKLTGYSSYTSDTVIYNRTFWSLLNFNGNTIFDGSVLVDACRMFTPKPNMFSSFVLFDTMPLESVRKFFKQLLEKKELGQFPNEVDFLHVRGIKLELTGSPDDAEPDTSMGRRIVLLIDGEEYDLETQTIEIWYKEDVVPIFSSYL